MSKNKGPFDAALIYLPDIDECRSAIRLLEATGRVDKAKLMVYLNHAIDWKENDSYGPGSAKEDRQLRALLESLPDKEKK